MLASPSQDKPGQPSAPRPSSIILDNLNAAQARAVRSNANTVAILAGPGSGKTHTLASRVVWLVDKAGHRPQDVLVATFTVKAAREMQARIGKALGEGRERKLVLGTFHSIARRYLAVYGSRIGLNTKFGIADDSDSRGVINRICKRLQLSCDPQRARAWISKKKAKGTAEEVQTSEPQASDKKSALRDLEACFNEYQRHLERSNLLDYDDLLVKCVALLRSHPECVSNLQAVLIDEYQDTNGVQYELMRLFAQRHRRITVVGDPDQSIYGWRSAEIKNLYRMLRDYPGTQEVALEENYRSSELILRTSLSVIQQDQTRYKKMLKPVHNRGTSPVLRKLRDAHAEADWIVSEIKRATLMSGGMMTHDDVAVLLRSAALSRHVESALGKAGIAYRMVGGFKFYDRSEIKIILDYLRVIHQPENNDALARILNVPRRGVGDGTVKNLVEEAEMSSMSLWTLLTKHFRGDRIAKSRMTRQAEQRMSRDLFRLLTGIRRKIDQIGTGTPFGLVEMIQELIVALRFQTFLEATHPDDHEQRWANVQEFFNLAADFVRDLEKAGDDSLPEIEGIQQTKEADALPRFLANVALASDAQTGETDEARTPLVTLSTIHAAKGLEWPVVFVPAVYNGSIPHARSEDGNEERRLLYVAMTRAQALLYLSYPTCSHGGDRNEPSPFVASLKNCFAKIGPCFDYSVMKQVSLILGRELPPEKDIFTSLPRTGFCLEDNKHPEDPEEETRWETGDDKWGHGSDASTAPRNKRSRCTGPIHGSSTAGEVHWQKEHKPTMEQGSSSTMSSLPGFVSAGAHQTSMAAAAAVAMRTATKSGLKRSACSKASNQQSIVGFVRYNKTGSGSLGTTSVLAQPERPQGVKRSQPPAPPASGIDPEYRAHKLRQNMLTRPARPPTMPKGEPPRLPYACFSSSPPRSTADDKVQAEEPAELFERSENEEAPCGPMRPAATLHQTTCTTIGTGGGLDRPVGLGRGGMAPMERLRKPFRPLTIRR